MLVFCDESWKSDAQERKVGTLAAISVARSAYNDLDDGVFLLAQKYFGFENARERELKGRQLLSAYEYAREANNQVSIKLSFARELLEEVRARGVLVFASVVYAEAEVDLLCEDQERLDRPYVALMERIEFAAREAGRDTRVALVFDDRSLMQNQRVAVAYRNFLSRSRTGRSYVHLLRTPFFAYSRSCTGLQVADVICTVVNRYYTEREKSPRIGHFFSLVRSMEWRAGQSTPEGFLLQGIRVLGDREKK